MNYIIMDLEWNGGYSGKTHGYFNEIMEIGAIKLDDRLRPIGEFHTVIRPALVRGLSKLVREMTGITRAELEQGIPFSQAMRRLKAFAGSPSVIITWSNTDLLMLEENFRYYNGSERIPFMTHYADLQAYCQERLGEGAKQQLGLEAACRLLEIDDQGADHHRALDDSRLTARILEKLFDPEAFAAHIKEADDGFYDRLNFKTSYVSDVESPLIDREALRFFCEECGTELEREKDWKYRSRGFCAPFHCPGCEKKYNARAQFKQKYDGIVIKRRLTPRQEKEGEEADGTAEAGGTDDGKEE